MNFFLTMLSTAVLGAAGVMPTVANFTSNAPKSSIEEINVVVPVEGNFLEISDRVNWNDDLNERGIWNYVTVNLGHIKASRVIGINSLYNDSYSEHNVNEKDFYNRDYTGGMHHIGEFQGVAFTEGKANPDWDMLTVYRNLQQNFFSQSANNLRNHTATTGIKYLWHYNNEGQLLVDIITYVILYISSTVGQSFAAVNLGSWITFYYKA